MRRAPPSQLWRDDRRLPGSTRQRQAPGTASPPRIVRHAAARWCSPAKPALGLRSYATASDAPQCSASYTRHRRGKRQQGRPPTLPCHPPSRARARSSRPRPTRAGRRLLALTQPPTVAATTSSSGARTRSAVFPAPIGSPCPVAALSPQFRAPMLTPRSQRSLHVPLIYSGSAMPSQICSGQPLHAPGLAKAQSPLLVLPCFSPVSPLIPRANG